MKSFKGLSNVDISCVYWRDSARAQNYRVALRLVGTLRSYLFIPMGRQKGKMGLVVRNADMKV
jgi:hypothetical protein